MERGQPRGQLPWQGDFDLSEVRLGARLRFGQHQLHVEARSVGEARVRVRGCRQLWSEVKTLAGGEREAIGHTRARIRGSQDRRFDLLDVAARRVEDEIGSVQVKAHALYTQWHAKHDLGRGSVVIVSAAVSGSIVIRARITTRPRFNGPAWALVTMLRPNGAPS